MELFKEYVEKYDCSDEDISYKYNHSLRVRDLSLFIAKKLNLNEREVELAGLCGLYHDIGRFEQDKLYDSFIDTKEYDHGDKGYEIFSRLFISKYSLTEKEQQIILKSILNHNKFAIKECDEKEELFSKIVRDADKLDILYVLSNKVQDLNSPNGEISNSVNDDFMSHKPIIYSHINSNADDILLKLAFIWDINFDVSLSIIKENHYYERLEALINDDRYKKYFKEIYEFLKEK